MVIRTGTRLPALRRLLVVLTTLVVAGVCLAGVGASETGRRVPAATPEAHCGPGARPEADIQGRVPQRDYDSGRVERGYRCNTDVVSRFGHTGGFKVLRYKDPAGHVCAFYDSTLLFPKDLPSNTVFTAGEGQGAIVLDMKRPAHPRQTDTLLSPAMQTPHESVLLNKRRGLLAATSGNAATLPGQLDVYDVKTDCRHPELLSSTPTAVLGHESGWAPDGKTFYASSTGGMTLTAIDLTDPTVPQVIFRQQGVNYHGTRVSRSGNLLYVANIGTDQASGAQFATGGLRIIDVSEIQSREPNPQIHTVADLTWPEMSIPQVPQPFVKNGRKYLLEVDEFANYDFTTPDQTGAPVGAARIIDVTDPADPRIVSDLRLQVHQPKARTGPERNDPGADQPVQGYAAHYCSVPRYRSPKLVACSMILSGLRVFDISDLRHPVEAAYFNKPQPGPTADNPTGQGGYAMSQPAWDARRHTVWYTDGNTGFFAIKLINGVGRLLD